MTSADINEGFVRKFS